MTTRTWKQSKENAAFWGKLATNYIRSAVIARNPRLVNEYRAQAIECARKAAAGGVR